MEDAMILLNDEDVVQESSHDTPVLIQAQALKCDHSTVLKER